MEINRNLIEILTFFFENPYEELHLRAISKRTKISIFSVKKSVDALISLNLLKERRVGRMRYIKANVDNLFFKYLKIAFNLKEILDSGIIEYLAETIPGLFSVVLFGSVAKGEDDENSDLDLLIIGQHTRRIDLKKFEERIGKEIKPIIMKWSEWKKEARKNRAFYLEVITTGICLYGNLPVVE